MPAPAPAAVPPFSEGDWQCSYCWTCNGSEHLECTKADCRLPFHKWGLLLSDEGKRSSRVRTKGKELLLNDLLLHSFLQIFDESCVQSFIGRVHTTLGGHSEHTTSGSGRLYVRGERFRV